MSKERVLIVEDEPITAEALAVMLREMNYEPVGIATTGEEAITLAKKMYPDVILMDIVLDGQMNGIEASKYIQSNYNIPIVFLTAYSDNETLDAAKKTEPFGYIVKPITDGDALRPTIEVALYNHKVKQMMEQDVHKLNQLKQIMSNEQLSATNLNVLNASQTDLNSKSPEFEDPQIRKDAIIIYLFSVAGGERFTIFDRLRTGALKILEIQDLIGKTQSTTSHHLKILETAGLVTGWKKERLTQFSINQDNFNRFSNLFSWWLQTFPSSSKVNVKYTLDSESKKFLSNCFDTLGSDDRFFILDRLREKPASVSSLEQVFQKPQTTIYHHIKQLEQNGLITSVISGKFTEYMPVGSNLKKIRALWELWAVEITNWFGK